MTDGHIFIIAISFIAGFAGGVMGSLLFAAYSVQVHRMGGDNGE